ncbi:hypothetical protein A9Q84_01555 [Halobacteriovorax marinus]|uniref:Lipoprotein n=1 Tax=Halobacteriovorax marinus TaxID=97084 RepID=A0A1Y5FIQ7_9BACT|nr:hypothetical protein A9Q84_01555 [Halobacteriovorax marinus]
MKTILALISITFCIQTSASVAQFSSLTSSLQSRYLIKVNHLNDVARKVRLATPSLLQRWGVLGKGVEAHYNAYLNLVVIRKEYVTNGRVYDFNDFKRLNKPYHFSTFGSTVFHELTHADMDVFIEESNSSFAYFLKGDLKKWFKKNHRRFNAKIAVHETLGYTADGIVEVLDNDISTLLLNFGYDFYRGKCFKKSALLRIYERRNLKEGIKFSSDDVRPYSERMFPHSIWVKGKDINLRSPRMPDNYRKFIFSYFQRSYELASSKSEYAKKMNDSKYLNIIKRCYTDAGIELE